MDFSDIYGTDLRTEYTNNNVAGDLFNSLPKVPQNNLSENGASEQNIPPPPIEDDSEYNSKCSELALSILENDPDEEDFYRSCAWDFNEMNKNPPGPPRRTSNRPTLQNLNPVFHRRDKSEDNKELSQTLLKQARKSGSLNLSGRGLSTGKFLVVLLYFIIFRSNTKIT